VVGDRTGSGNPGGRLEGRGQQSREEIKAGLLTRKEDAKRGEGRGQRVRKKDSRTRQLATLEVENNKST